MTSSSFTSSNSNLNREDSFTNLSNIIMGEKKNPDIIALYKRIDELSKKNKDLSKRNNDLSKKNNELNFEINQINKDNKVAKKDFKELKQNFDELVLELKKSKKRPFLSVFLQVSNKWKLIYDSACCSSRCVNDQNPNATCNNGWGFVQIISDTIVKYNCKNRFNGEAMINAMNNFSSPRPSHSYVNNYTSNTLFYYEVKVQIERSKPLIEIGFRNGNYTVWHYFYFCPSGGYFSYYDNAIEKDKFINLSSSFSFNNEDIIGCGVVYPPSHLDFNYPYIFFTQNGEQIGKFNSIYLKDFTKHYLQNILSS
ncbi:hypothetical protein Mgra_00003443 [Meloidogyne graminicola]|uniref:Uncharacterized protein n=1 Tax=Meloidogyne graminicola TaxID=189291 RepID=A0A8S9ZTM1_9BILA|nr:hypothetical protein Mgra_00003443 [Meloidogyne graminicola]